MFKNGFTFLEILIVIFIFSIFLIPVTLVVQRYHQSYLLNSSSAKIVEGINFARECAINERCNFSVIFDERSFKIFKVGENEKILIWKEIKLPENIKIKEKSEGMDPLIFLPDGTAKEAGYLILIDEISKKIKKIKVHNVTGKCVIEG
ncbi:MAG: pilus assembly FimT family protein [Candidatus Ratteibacteria bacterium]